MIHAPYTSLQIEKQEVGINLGGNWCSEHEWGIEGIHNAFGISVHAPEQLGFEAKKMTILPQYAYFNNSKNEAYLILDSTLEIGLQTLSKIHQMSEKQYLEYKIDQLLNNELSISNYKKTAVAWDKSSFGIHTKNELYFGIMDAFQDALLTNDLVIDDTSLLRINGGFNLLIYSRIPEEVKNLFREQERKNKSDY